VPVYANEGEELTQEESMLDSEDPTEGATMQDGEETQSRGSVAELTTGNFSVTPVVANEKAKPRDIIKKELLVTNNTQQRVDLYISVKNIDPTQGDQEFESPAVSDLSTSLANWVEITRGVIELGPGESRKIPYLIHINLTAKPGSYYARVQFQEGTRRAEAEASSEGASLLLNVEVEDDANERLQLGNFMAEDGVVFGNSVSFSYLLENVGNRMIEPRGSIRIFNRRGEEVGSIPLNAEGEEITPENKSQLAAVWSSTGRFGKYKAFLDLEYGENQLASVQDTVYFWVFPWKEIMMTLGGIMVLAVVGTYIVHMRALATPARARRNSGFEGEYASPTPNPYAALSPHPAKHLYPRRVATNTTQPTVLSMPQRGAHTVERSVVESPRIHSSGAVELTPRTAVRNVQAHGNVVQLSSRR